MRMIGLDWGSILLIMVLIIVILFLAGSKARTPEQFAKWLGRFSKILNKNNWKILVRPNGQMVGLMAGEEPWFDEQLGMKRKQIIFYDFNGTKQKEPRDFVNKKASDIEDLIAIEFQGGIALTQSLGGATSISPILFGSTAENIKRSHDDFRALENEYIKQEKKHEVIGRRYQELQNELSNTRIEKENTDARVNEMMQANAAMNDLNQRLDARIKAADARNRMLEVELDGLVSRHTELEKEVQEVIKRARERELEAVAIGAPKVRAKVELIPATPVAEEKKVAAGGAT